jgi:hypothetical protein
VRWSDHRADGIECAGAAEENIDRAAPAHGELTPNEYALQPRPTNPKPHSDLTTKRVPLTIPGPGGLDEIAALGSGEVFADGIPAIMRPASGRAP